MPGSLLFIFYTQTVRTAGKKRRMLRAVQPNQQRLQALSSICYSFQVLASWRDITLTYSRPPHSTRTPVPSPHLTRTSKLDFFFKSHRRKWIVLLRPSITDKPQHEIGTEVKYEAQRLHLETSLRPGIDIRNPVKQENKKQNYSILSRTIQLLVVSTSLAYPAVCRHAINPL